MRDSVERFYTAFAARDADGMIAEYAPDVVFEDPVFGVLRGNDACDMWRMLCAGAEDLAVSHHITGEEGNRVHARWVANYTFGPSGRQVTNRIETLMTFSGEKIIDHRDQFSLWAWTAQALGPIGRSFGWTPSLQRRVRADASRGLRRYQASRS